MVKSWLDKMLRFARIHFWFRNCIDKMYNQLRMYGTNNSYQYSEVFPLPCSNLLEHLQYLYSLQITSFWSADYEFRPAVQCGSVTCQTIRWLFSPLLRFITCCWGSSAHSSSPSSPSPIKYHQYNNLFTLRLYFTFWHKTKCNCSH